MRPRDRFLVSFVLSLLAATPAVKGQAIDNVATVVNQNQRDLGADGRDFLLKEVRQASFLLVGGLHGDNETQALVQLLVPGLGDGPKLTLTEMSPWSASRVFGAIPESSGVRLRGADIEEAQLAAVIRELAAGNPQHRIAQEMLATIKPGYSRTLAREVLALARQVDDVRDASPGGLPLLTLLIRSLEVEVDRSRPETSGLGASLRREAVMKDFFLTHYRAAATGAAKPKVAAAFGRNHLHRGIDRRGVSTLGNFIAEFAIAEGTQAFNVALFAAGGRIALGGVREFDERKADPAFDYLASLAKYPVTVFDMRPLREPLRNIPPAARTPAQNSLLYWADSYDAVVCYREVTPLGSR